MFFFRDEYLHPSSDEHSIKVICGNELLYVNLIALRSKADWLPDIATLKTFQLGYQQTCKLRSRNLSHELIPQSIHTV